MSDLLILDSALRLAQQGFAVHWLRPHSKIPVNEGWSTAPVTTPDDLRATYRPGYNVGVRCGHWSQPMPGYGLEVFDIDIRDCKYTTDALEALEALLPDSLHIPVVLSGGGNSSRHLWFRCPIDLLPPRANITIAKGPEPADKTWKIEVFSTGKQATCPPSIHPISGRAYRWLVPFDGPPPAIPEVLLQAIQTATISPKPVYHPPTHYRHDSGDSIADAFRVVSWADILEPHGWQFVRQAGERQQWVRPGKDARQGISATTTGDVFFPFTSSTEFEPGRGYSKFHVYAMLEHSGDMSQAARHLRGAGIGRAA